MSTPTVALTLALGAAWLPATAWADCVAKGGGQYQCSGTSASTALDENALDVTADGSYVAENTSSGGAGISLKVKKNGGSLLFTQQAGSKISGEHGALINNDGTGSTVIDIAGSISTSPHGGTEQDGLNVSIGPDSTGLSIKHSGRIEGGQNGIYAANYGTGAITATLSGDVIARSDNGVYLTDQGVLGAGISLTQSAGTIRGGETGINVQNEGGGAIDIRLAGKLESTAATSYGILAWNAGASATDVRVTQTAGSIDSAGLAAIAAWNNGTGSTSVSLSGSVKAVAPGADGVQAYNNGTTTQNVIVDQQGGEIVAGGRGIHAMNLGSGSTTVTVNGTVQAGNRAAIQTTAANGATVNIGSAATVTATSGIAIRDGGYADEPTDAVGGNVTINSAGTVSGDAIMGLGNDSFNLTGGSYTGNIYGDDRDDPQSGDGQVNHEGNDSFVWRGGKLAGNFYGQDGSDTATVSASEYDGSQRLDGGDDSSTADGMVDTLDFKGIAATTKGAYLPHWEVVNLDGAKLGISDGAWKVGEASEADTGVHLSQGATLDGMTGLALDGNLILGAGSSFLGKGGGAGVYAVSGRVDNAGNISLQDGKPGDVLSIAGNYIGNGGSMALDTALGGDDSPTDKVNIAGDTSGTTLLEIVNAGGAGAPTRQGIEVIAVGGQSLGTFNLKGSYVINGKPTVVGGAYAYQLYKGNRSNRAPGNWYLRSELVPVEPEPGPNPTPEPPPEPEKPLYQAGVPDYEAYPAALLGLNSLPTMQQRIGNRYWGENAGTATTGSGGTRVDGGDGWGRVESSDGKSTPRFSTSDTRYTQNVYKLQTGVGGVLDEDRGRTLIGGASVHYVHGNTRTSSPHGDGRIGTGGYGLGGSLTWYAPNGVYLDTQAQATWYSSDLSSSTAARSLVDNNHGFGFALSAEGGRRIAIKPAWSLTPQAQLQYSKVDFDGFTDSFGARVRSDRGSSLQGRLGLAVDHDAAWQDEAGRTSRAHVYGIANLYYEFRGAGTRVKVADTPFERGGERLWGGLGLGGTRSWNGGKYALFGELLATSSIKHFGDSYRYVGQVGFRMKW